MTNGIALSPDGKKLWITEFSKNSLHRVHLADPTTIAPIHTAVSYQFTGPAPDSMRVDTDGNIYVAMYEGRVLAFNRSGIPIGQTFLPGRDQRHNLQCTSMAIKPGTNEAFIVTSDGSQREGATIFSKSLRLYSYQ